MTRTTTRTVLLPAALLLTTLAACAGASPTGPGASPTGPGAPTLRLDITTPTDTATRKVGNYENPTV